MRPNAKLRDMNACMPAKDERAIEVLATGLPLHHGAQLAVDKTLRSALTACGRARPNAAHTNCSTERQRTEVPRTSDKRAVPARGCGSGDRRQMERRSDGVYPEFGGGQISGSATIFARVSIPRLEKTLDQDAGRVLRTGVRIFFGLSPL